MALKVSQEYSLLRPYIVAEIINIVNRRGAAGGGGGSVGIGGAPSPHQLGSSHHAGLLLDDQAPQFPLLSGTRTYTGNIVFAGAQTVDGVDISAHAANANAHHNAATAGDGIVINGSQVVSVDLADTSGLTFSAGDLAVGAGDGIDVLSATIAVDVTDIIDTAFGLTEATNNIRINLAATSGLAFSAGALTVGAGDGIDVLTATIAVDVTDFIDTAFGLTESSNNIRVNLAATSGLEFSAGALQIADSVAGGGLSIASKVLAVNVGDGLEIATDSVAVDLAADPGLEFSSGDLRTIAPATLTHATTNSRSAGTHAITSASDVGTTPAESLLKSTSAGGLTLGTLQVRGLTEVVNNGNFFVGGGSFPTLYVLNTGDPSTARVGINRIPDPQFSLDVSGPLRADYLIGKHAIQVKDALLIAQYDGGLPPETNFTGEPNGHFGQVATTLGGVVFRPGIFQKALQIADSVTNLMTNPSAETNTTGYSAVSDATISQSLEESWIGSNSIKVVRGSTGSTTSGIAYAQASGISASTQYTISLWVKGDSLATDLTLQIRNEANSASLVAQNFQVEPDDIWKLVTQTFTSDAGQTTLRWRIVNTGSTAMTYYVDAVHCNAGATAIPYADGSMGGFSATGVADNTGHAWTGTEHASTSTRLGASLSYPESNFPRERGTIMCWVRLPWGDAPTTRSRTSYIWGMGTNHGLRYANNGTLFLRLGGTGDWDTLTWPVALRDKEWHFVAVTFDIHAGTCALYIDDGTVASGTIATATTAVAFTAPGPLFVGSRNGSADRIDGWIDCFATINRELPTSEIHAIYESVAPIFAEHSVFAFRATPRGLVWADEYGLWMRDVSGDAVFGAYGGEPASWSWGGKTLARGDILFGRYGAAEGGWMHWDRDGDAGDALMTIGYSDKDVLTFTGTSAKMKAANLEITNSSSQEIMGVFATTPPVSWAGIAAVAAGDVVIGDADRGAVAWWDDSAASLSIGRTGASNTYLSLTGTSASLIHNSVTRVFLDSTGLFLRDAAGANRVTLGSGGALTIMNSSSQAVFTFDSSAGAEFTLPLTLGTSGGIYQGSGTFGTPTTGLKVWNDTGIGRIAGFNSGTLQWGADTSGRLTFGGGNGRLGADGLHLIQGGGTFTLENSVGWWNSFANITADQFDTDLYGFVSASSGLGMVVQSNGSIPLRLQNYDGASDSSIIELNATAGGTNTIGMFAEALNITAPVAITGATAVTGAMTVSSTVLVGATSIARTLPAQSTVQVEGQATGSGIAAWQNTNDANGPILVLGKTRGTVAGSNAIVTQNDRLGSVQFWGGDGGSTTAAMAAEIYVTSAGTPGNNDMPGQLHISTSPDGSATPAVRVRVTHGGLVGVNTSPAAGQFEVVSADNARVAAVIDSAASPSVDILRVLRNSLPRVTVDSTGDLVLNNSDVVTGPKLFLQSVKSTAGAAFDMCGTIRGMAKNSASVDKIFADVYFQILTATNGSEKGGFFVVCQDGGSDAFPLAAMGSRVGINESVTADASLHVRQPHTTGAIPALHVEQTDVDFAMMGFQGQAGAGTSNNFDTGAIGTYAGRMQVLINGAVRWIPYYS